MDGTLLDFNQSEALGIKKLLEHCGLEPRQEYLDAYHRINDSFWKAFERGEIAKDRLVTERFVRFFGELGKQADGRGGGKFLQGLPGQHGLSRGTAPWSCAPGLQSGMRSIL